MSEVVLLIGVVTGDLAIVGPVVSVLTVALAALGYRQATRRDKVAIQTAAVTASGTAVQQVIDGLNHIVDNLQQDNKVLRKNVDSLSKRLNGVIEENHALKDRVAELTQALP